MYLIEYQPPTALNRWRRQAQAAQNGGGSASAEPGLGVGAGGNRGMDGISGAGCGLVDGMSTAGMAFVKEHAAGEISPGRLRRYLRDEACSPGQKEIRAEACRSCESACA